LQFPYVFRIPAFCKLNSVIHIGCGEVTFSGFFTRILLLSRQVESVVDLRCLLSLQCCNKGFGDFMSFTKKQLMPGENLIILARQHPLVLFKPVLTNAIALALLIGLYVYLQQIWLLALYGIPLIYLMWSFLSWHQKEYIITDRRVVLHEGVLSVSSFDASLDKINNVYHNQSFLGRLLNYGNVGLETASEMGTTTFELLSRPVDFKNSIVRQRELYRMDSGSAGRPLPPNIPQLLEELASLRDRGIITESEFQEKKRSLLQKI
jgi:hypothetical protein